MALLQFRAGKMNKSGNLVSPDKRRGVVALYGDPTGLIELHWTTEGSPAETTMIFPGDATVERVTKCTTGRVFVIDFHGARQLFFWLQEKSEDRDEEYLKLLKRHIEGKKPGQTSTASAPANQAAQPGSSIDMSMLNNVLKNLGAAPEVHIQDILSSPQLAAALREDPAFYMTRLHAHLPTGTDPAGDVVTEVCNAQFSATGALLEAALSQPDGFKELMQQFAITTSSRAAGTSVFLEAVVEEGKKKSKDDKNVDAKK